MTSNIIFHKFGCFQHNECFYIFGMLETADRGKELGGKMTKHSDGIVCSAVTVIYTSLFTTVFETPLSMPLIGEGKNITNNNV